MQTDLFQRASRSGFICGLDPSSAAFLQGLEKAEARYLVPVELQVDFTYKPPQFLSLGAPEKLALLPGPKHFSGLPSGKALLERIRPMCQETQRLLTPVKVNPQAYIKISVETDEWFKVEIWHKPNQWDIDLAKLNGEQAHAKHPTMDSTDWFTHLPERKQVPGKPNMFLVGATDLSCLLILATWEMNRIKFADEEAAAVFSYLTMRFVSQISTAEKQAIFKTSGSYCTTTNEIISKEGRPLGVYQKVAAQCAVESPDGYALFMDRGTGKSYVGVAAIEAEVRKSTKKTPYYVWIACPKNVMTNWAEEIRQGSMLPVKVTICRGSKVARVKAFIDCVTAEKSECEWSVLITSYDTVRNTSSALTQFNDWDLGLTDESHNYKSKQTKLWPAIEAMRDVCKKRIPLSGTPILNSLNDLWTQLEFLGKGMSGFVTREAFRKFYGSYISDGWGCERLVSFKNVPLIQERLARLSFVILLKDALPSLPGSTYSVIDVEMSKEQEAAYNAVAASLRVEIADEMNSDKPKAMTVNNVLTRLLRLAQITSGFLTIDPVYNFDSGELVAEKEINRFNDNPKLDELIRHVKELPRTSKFITWACWRQDIKTIQARMELEGIKVVTLYGATKDRDAVMKAFNEDPTVRGIIANAGVGGEGVNLLGQAEDGMNCDTVYYYSQDWSFKKRSQSEARNLRRGTRAHVQYYDLCVPDTIDEEIRKRVTAKGQHALAIQDLRDILDKVLECSAL